jgi:cyclic-di-GMP phosphodiesterase TipF (flagellum assembly factor)
LATLFLPPAAPEPVVTIPPVQHFPGATPEQIRAAEIARDALERRRVDLFVQPIVRLPQRRIEYLEIFTHLRARDGSLIRPPEFIEAATRAGLIPAIDNVMLSRCVEQVRRDLARNAGIGYFCNISARTLADTEFFPLFAQYLEANAQLSRHVVFELSQADFNTLPIGARRQIERLGAAGYRLSLDGVGSLDLDYLALARSYFGFVKIDAATLSPQIGETPAVDVDALKARLGDAGIALIVEKIESEDVLLDLLDYYIDYGQGYLFGMPVKAR